MPRVKKTEEPKIEAAPKKEKEKESVIIATGRRKSAVARVFLHSKKGDFIVNGMPINDYFEALSDKSGWLRPFHAVGVSHPDASFSASVIVKGSGMSAQLDAVTLGFSRALLMSNAEFRTILRKQGFLTRDPRNVERKKPYLRKARKKPQFSKR